MIKQSLKKNPKLGNQNFQEEAIGLLVGFLVQAGFQNSF